MGDRILLIGTARWAAALRRHSEVAQAQSGKHARAFDGQRFSLIVVDAASMYISGERICRDMKSSFPDSTQILISGALQAESISEADIILDPAATARQMNGAVSRLLSADPLDSISCGPFSLNRTTRILAAHGRRIPLNPKLASLIELLMSNPNQTLPRAHIMQEVWKTAYLGDTRTLNVHIRRAREVLEQDPQHPVYLKTARGQGYRLEIAENDSAGVRRRTLTKREKA